MLNEGTVSVIIPAFNEEKRIGATIDALKELDVADEIIVVDDGSTDSTAREAVKHGARIVALPRNRGKGAALNEGLAASLGGFVVFIDADLGEAAEKALPIIDAVKSGDADIAVGAFSHKSAGGTTIAMHLARWCIRATCGRNSIVPISGQRAMRREVLEAVYPLRTDFGAETAMTIDALRAGFRLKEVPVDISHPQVPFSMQTILHSTKRNIGITRAIMRALYKYKRPRLPRFARRKKNGGAGGRGDIGVPPPYDGSPGELPPY